jgi:hypothetical protein
VRELLFNVVKHAGVKRATVRINRNSAGRLEILVSDKGRGFSPRAPSPAREASHRLRRTAAGRKLSSALRSLGPAGRRRRRTTIRVLLADDHKVMRDGLATFLESVRILRWSAWRLTDRRPLSWRQGSSRTW